MLTCTANRKLADGRTGQALVELAVFGTIFLMVMGALISYGLRYNAQQEASMMAFRRALRIASDPNQGGGSVTVVKSQDTPDPADLFGIGSSQPVMASASVVKNPVQHWAAENAESLSGGIMDIQTDHTVGSGGATTDLWRRMQFMSAAFRIEKNVSTDAMEKYKAVYGSVLAKKAGTSAPITSGNHWVSTSSDEAEKSDIASTCHEETTYDYDGNPVTETVCDKAYSEIRITDGCSGEIIDYATCYAQARLLVDPDYCFYIKNDREKVPGDDTDYTALCNKNTNAPNPDDSGFDPDNGGAWYAADYYCVNRSTGATGNCGSIARENRRYVFPYLSAMFAHAGEGPEMKGMGIQQDTTSSTMLDRTISKDETQAAITTTETAQWENAWEADLIYQNNMGGGGFEQTHSTPGEYADQVDSQVIRIESSGTVDQTTQTNK